MKRFGVLSLSMLLWLAGSRLAASQELRVLAFETEEFFYGKDGQPGGIEYAILQLFAKTRGVELRIEWAESFPELLARMEKGEADIGAGTITDTSERRRRFDVSSPYFPVQVFVVAAADSGLRTPGDLTGARVGAYRETTAEEALSDIEGVEVVYLNGLENMFAAIERGEIDAVAADSSAIIPALEDHPSCEIAMTLGKQQHFAFALPRGSTWRKPLSEHIARLKESGVYLSIVSKELGPRAAEIVRLASKLP